MIKINKEIISEKRSISEVEPLLMGIKSKFGIADEHFYNVLIAVTEAVNNAIIHGNKCNPAKYVEISIEAEPNYIKVVVLDHGDGFSPDEVDDPRKQENLLKEGGRGVFLIKELASNYSYDFTNGTKITMLFHIG